MQYEDPRVSFGKRLRYLRKQKGLSQEALAHEAELDRSYVGGVERGEYNISLLNICILAAALNLPPAELLRFADLQDGKKASENSDERRTGKTH